MFESLDDKMKADAALETSPGARFAQRAVVALLSIVLFAGLYFVVRLMD